MIRTWYWLVLAFGAWRRSSKISLVDLLAIFRNGITGVYSFIASQSMRCFFQYEYSSTARAIAHSKLHCCAFSAPACHQEDTEQSPPVHLLLLLQQYINM